MVEHLTHDLKLEGSKTATAQTETIIELVYVWTEAEALFVEQSTQNLKFEGSHLATTLTINNYTMQGQQL